jgi:hypothetical protein
MMTVNWHPDRAQLRSFGLACVVAFGALGAVSFIWRTVFGLALSEPTSVRVAIGFWVVAAASGLLAATAPMALRPLYRGLTAVSLPIGYVVSHVVMATVFFGVLTPIGLVLRVVRRDPLARGREPARRTYWEPRTAVGDVKRYYRQF